MSPLEPLVMLEQLDPFAAEAPSTAWMHAGMVDLDGSFIFMLGLFLVFAVALTVLVVKPLMTAQRSRFAGMDGARREASSLGLQAAETRVAYEAKIADARHEAVTVRDGVRDEATSHANTQLAEAKKRTDDQVAARQAALQAAADKARAEMQKTADELANTLADKLLASKGGA